MSYNPGAGQGPPPALGSFYNEEGQRRSARIAALKNSTINDFGDGPKKLLAILKGTAAGGRRHRLVGGDGEIDDLIEFLTPYAKSAAEYLLRKGKPIGDMAGRVVSKGLATGDKFIDGLSATVVLVMSGVGGTVGTVGAVLSKYAEYANSAAEYYMSDESHEKLAGEALKDIKHVATTLAVTMLAANTVGLLPLSTILAGALYGAGAAASPSGRATMITGFYQWYLTLPKTEQDKVLEAAQEYGKAARMGVVGVAGAAAAVAKSITDANKKAAAMNKGLPADVAQVITNKNLVSGAPGAANPVVTGAVATEMLAAAAAPPAAPAPAAPAPAPAASDAVPPPGTRAPTTRERAAAADAARAAAAPATRMGTRSSTRTGNTGGRRKTRSKKTKRRVTRRRSMPTFAY